jgi:hypothetical protein
MSLFRLLSISFLLFLAACAGPTTSQIEARDGAFVPSLRVAVDVFGTDGEPRSDVHAGHAIELGLAGARGEDTQTLNAGDRPIRFGGQTFNAPQQLKNEFRFGYVEALYRYRWFWGNAGNFGLEAVGGLGHAGLDLKVSSPTQSASENFGNGGLVFGGGMVGRLSSTLSLQARYTVFGSGRQEGVTGVGRFDLMVAHSLGRNAGVRGGWSSWTVRSGREADDSTTSNKSPITIRFAGPALGLELMF